MRRKETKRDEQDEKTKWDEEDKRDKKDEVFGLSFIYICEMQTKFLNLLV